LLLFTNAIWDEQIKGSTLNAKPKHKIGLFLTYPINLALHK
jgi:hypothetical protein